MNKVYTSLKLLNDCLISSNIDYAIIGGVAVAVWGEPRLTKDIDVKVLLSRKESEKLFDAITKQGYQPFGDNPIEKLKKYGILFVHDTCGIRIDLHLSDTSFDRKVIKRACKIEIESGITVNICSAEDLIIYKMLSTRSSDSRDFESIIDCQGNALDDQYIIKWLKQFEIALDDSTLIKIYQKIRSLI